MLALAPRLAWVLGADAPEVYRRVYDAPPVDYAVPPSMDDVTYYIHTARSIGQGHGYDEPFLETASARYPPGWPGVLSVFYRAFGENALPAVIFNAAAGAATVVVTYFLGARLFGRTVGLGAATLMSLFPVHVLFSPLLLSEVFFALLLTLTLLVACWGIHDWRAFVLGLLAGAAALVRGEAVLLPGVFAVVLLLRSATWRATARQMALVAAGMAVLLAPWAVRNSLVFDSPVLMTTQVGFVLHIGHGSDARGAPDVDSYFELAERYRDRPEPQRQLDIDRAALREAWEGFRSDPLGDLALVPKKLGWFYGRDPLSGPVRLLVARFWHGPLSFQTAQAIAAAYYYLILAGTVLLLVLRYPSSWRGAYGLLFGLIGLWSFIFGFLFFGDDRYHVPLLPAFSIAAAGGFAAGTSRLAALAARLAGSRAAPGLESVGGIGQLRSANGPCKLGCS